MALIHTLTGDRYGRLVITGAGPVERRKGDNSTIYTATCICDCGKSVTCKLNSLRTGKTTSCGCLRKERERHFRTPESAALHNILNRYKSGARTRGHLWALTREQYKQVHIIGSSPCVYCGAPPVNKEAVTGEVQRRAYTTEWAAAQRCLWTGLDRIDSTKGYTLENIQACCSVCNRMKLDLTEERFLAHINKITRYRKIDVLNTGNVGNESH
jgi:hypothetical protein